jgi:cation diffusion facilitator CzcD-associated flavoprotein CzcO
MSVTQKPLKVLVLGGGYGGLAAGLNLLDMCQGKTGRFYQTAEKKNDTSGAKFPIKVKFVDERDGYCKFGRQS